MCPTAVKQETRESINPETVGARSLEIFYPFNYYHQGSDYAATIPC